MTTQFNQSRGNKILADAIAQRTEASIRGHALGRNKTSEEERGTRREIREHVIARLTQNHNLDTAQKTGQAGDHE